MKHRNIRWRFVAACLGLFAPLLVIIMAPVQTAFAVGETYAWTPGGNIQMIGGNGKIQGVDMTWTGNFFQETPNRSRGTIVFSNGCSINADVITNGDRKAGKLDNMTKNNGGQGCTEQFLNEFRQQIGLGAAFNIGDVQNAPAPNNNMPLGNNPTPGGVINPAEEINDLAKDQEECNSKGQGQIFDKKTNKCRAPTNAKECTDAAPGSTFIEGKDGEPNKCDIDNDPCMIPKDGAAGSTALRWLACPLIESANWFLLGCVTPKPDTPDGKGECTGGLNGIISALLYTDTSSIFGTQNSQLQYQDGDARAYNATSAAYYRSWGVFRSIGVGLVIIAGLIMIVSEAFGVGVVDAYTIRKLLPRLLVAAIGITLSWSLSAFLITLFNDLGSWARDLIQFPFNGLNAGNVSFATVAAQWLGLLGGGFYLAAMGPAAVLSMLFTVAVAMLVGAAVLILRQMLIILCVLVSPLAIAASVLPNTQKLFSLWLSTFVRTLVMFPIIIGFLALGAVFSAIASTTPSAGSSIIGIVAYIAPYFMLPYAFKLAGGAMATVGGAVGGVTSGFFKARKEKHGEAFKDARRRVSLGDGFKNKGIRKKINGVTLALGSAKEGLRFRSDWKNFGAKNANGRRDWKMYNKDRLQSATFGRLSVAGAEHAAKDAHWQAIKGNDDYARAATGFDEEDGYHRMMDHARKSADITRRKAREGGMSKQDADAAYESEVAAAEAPARHAAAMVEANGGYSRTRQHAAVSAVIEAGTAARGTYGGEAVMDIAETIKHVADGNRVHARNLGASTASLHGAAGRYDGDIGAGGWVKTIDEAMDGTLTTAKAKERMRVANSNRAPQSKMAGGKPTGTEAIISTLTEHADKMLEEGKLEEYKQDAADSQAWKEAGANASGLSHKHVIAYTNEHEENLQADINMRKTEIEARKADLSAVRAQLLQNQASAQDLKDAQAAHDAAAASLENLETAVSESGGMARSYSARGGSTERRHAQYESGQS